MDCLNKLSEDWNSIKDIAIWGTGILATRVITKLQNDFNIVFAIDEKRTEFQDIQVISYEDAREKYDLKGYKIVITTTARWYGEIKTKLEDDGLVEYKDFCNIEQFIPEWYWKNREQCVAMRIDSVVTTYCTLECKNCNMFIPYYNKNSHTSFEELKENFDTVFKNIDYIFSYILIGGEPFLNPELCEIIEYLYDNYSNHIGKIEIVSNGTVRLKQSVIDTLKKCHVQISISDYTENVQYTYQLNCFIESLQANQIEHRVNKSLLWCDFRFPHSDFYIKDIDAIKKHMKACSPTFQSINNGKLYYCNVAWSAEKSQKYKPDKIQYFDMTMERNSNQMKKQCLEYILGKTDDGYLDFCRYCGGCGADNRSFVEAGCQMKKGEKSGDK